MNPTIALALRDTSDVVSDFKQASYQASTSVLRRLVLLLDSEPLAGVLRSILRPVDFTNWWENSVTRPSGMVGSGVLEWPNDRAERVALQIAMCRAVSEQQISLVSLMHDYFPRMDNLTQIVRGLASHILDPMIRDMARLAEKRSIPAVLSDALGQLPKSGDATLDGLLTVACEKFRDTAPATRRDATEKLWDAWERLKSIDSDDKAKSMESMLDRASSEPEFRKRLENEAGSLTKIGNDFHIRHFEKNRIELERPEHFDYLFYRLLAMIQLLLLFRPK